MRYLPSLGSITKFSTVCSILSNVLPLSFSLILSFNNHEPRYAYSDEIGAQSDDEEAQSLNRAKPESELSFAKQVQNVDEDDDREADKGE